MKLNKYNFDKKETYYIGAATGYICITGSQDIKKHLRHWDEYYKRNAQAHLERLEKLLKRFGALAPSQLRSIDEDRKYLKHYTPLYKREVIREDKRMTGGIALILEGPENGRFWVKEEYDHYWEG